MSAQQLALGTAQFGLDYGITNAAGRVAQPAAVLQLAWNGGVRMLDTAHAYGDGERVLGGAMQAPWRIVAKTKPGAGVAAVDSAFGESLGRLRVEAVDTLLVHHAADLLGADGDALFRWLASQKQQGKARRIGASVYDGQEIAALLGRFGLDVVQLPASIADQRLLADGSLAKLRAAGVEVHVRSLFLQGILLAPAGFGAQRFPQQAGWLADFHAECAARSVTAQQACLSFFKWREEFTVAVAGVTNGAELSQLLAAWEEAPALDWSGWGVDNASFTDPRLWSASP